MGFIYSAPMDAQAFTTATDLFEVTTVAADNPIVIHQLNLCQTTDLGDAQEEVLRIGIYRGATAGATGTGATETPYNRGDTPATSGVVVNLNRGTASTGGTLLDIIGWNIRVPLQYIWTPETRIRIDSTEDPFTFRLMAAPADSITISGSLIWEEV